MQKEHQIIAQVYAAKDDLRKADDLIGAYIPFIRAEAAKFLSRVCTDQDDEYSIAMIAFHEAIQGYTRLRGTFLRYAAMVIRSRLIDYRRKEARHEGHISIYEEHGEDDTPLHERLTDHRDHYEEAAGLEATRQEIQELSAVMAGFGVTLSDVSSNSPKQERTLGTCRKAVHYAIEHPELLDELLRTKKLPLAALVSGSGADRKTLERHRKYVLAMLLIQTNGYEIIRGHLRHTGKGKGGAPV